MDKDTQLPAEALARVDDEAKKFAFYNYVTPVLQPDAEFDNFDTWPEQARVCYYSILHYMTRPDICWPYAEPTLATEYATKLHQAQLENVQLKGWKMEAAELLAQIHAYAYKSMEVKLGQCNIKAVIERCKQFEQAQKVFKKVIDLYDLTPEDELYNEIKTFLDGTT